MNLIKFKLIVWKHPALLSLPFMILLIVQPLLIVIYFFIALLHFIAFDSIGIKLMKNLIKKKK